jgi:hypothetical protein
MLKPKMPAIAPGSSAAGMMPEPTTSSAGEQADRRAGDDPADVSATRLDDAEADPQAVGEEQRGEDGRDERRLEVGPDRLEGEMDHPGDEETQNGQGDRPDRAGHRRSSLVS